MNRTIAIFTVAVSIALAPASGSFASQGSVPASFQYLAAGGANVPLTAGQIASEFTRLPIETQKMLIKILVSEDSARERQATTQELDAIYATLPIDVQRRLYVKWDALSDEQRIALRGMDPEMMKSVLGAAVIAEIGRGASRMLAPVEKILNAGTSLAKNSRAYVQKMLFTERVSN